MSASLLTLSEPSYDDHPIIPEVLVPSSHLPFGLQRNLIIGCATNMDLRTLYRFVRSARSCCNTSSIHLLLNASLIAQQDYQDLARIYRVVYVSYEKLVEQQEDEQVRIKHVVLLRWFLIKHYLNTLQPEYDNIFITDTRDGMYY